MTRSVLDIPTGVDDFTLEQAFFLLKDLYTRVDAHAAEVAALLDLLCHAGCSGCCRDSVFVTTLEALYLLHHIQVELTDAQRVQILDDAERTLAMNRERIFSFGHPDCPGAPPLSDEDAVPRPRPVDRVLSARALRFDCPILDGAGLCQAYPARELRARLFAVSRLHSRDEYYACDLLGHHLDGKEVRLIDAEAVESLLKLYPLTRGEQVLPYYLWRYASLLR